ncbi:hypothetical protein H0264_35635 [Nocardia huaxiensis]|uniref:Uncharacterized protein n=1 Tax=Nocardia huaxiensis TaxID=2755382 RepID=A0A7D6ZCI0_9NOCA|nr:hypothetical protein [Nocardia huaxiensis]QLY30398.1 hypothetical protein H0264_35635 [Nocardia huaxiensis]
MSSDSISYVQIGLADDLKPMVPPGDDPAAASAIANFALAQQTVFDTKLRRFLSGHCEAAPTIAAYAWELSGAMNTGVLDWIRQWPTEAAEIDPDFNATQQDAIDTSARAATKPTGSGLAIPESDDPETVYEITAFVFRMVRELRAEITIFANSQYAAAPASADHAWNLSTSYLRLLGVWALSWPE